MSLHPHAWAGPFELTGSLPWLCPDCGVARLRVKADTLADGETRASKASHSHDAWEPEWIAGRFSCLLECPHCAGEIGVAGTYTVKDERGYAEDEEVGEYVKYYQPGHFTEAPRIIDMPEATPAGVVSEVEKSFQLYWTDRLACANRIRVAVELLLTAQRVNRSVGGPRTGKPRKMLSLHRRIELFGATKSHLADKLMAIKWIGNAGSHADIVEEADVLDAYDILCFVLDELYVKRSKRIGALARAINRREAPRSKRRATSR
jgi:hypothetical protein